MKYIERVLYIYETTLNPDYTDGAEDLDAQDKLDVLLELLKEDHLSIRELFHKTTNHVEFMDTILEDMIEIEQKVEELHRKIA